MYGSGSAVSRSQLWGRTCGPDSDLLSFSSTFSSPQRDGLRCDRERLSCSSSPRHSQHFRPLDSYALPGGAAYAGCVLDVILQPPFLGYLSQIGAFAPSLPGAGSPSPKSPCPQHLVYTDLDPRAVMIRDGFPTLTSYVSFLPQ